MQRNQPGSISSSLRCGLVLFVLTLLPEFAHAQTKLSPSEQFPGPWLEVTKEVRDLLALHKVSACDQAVERPSSRTSGEYLLYCTQDERHWTSWHVQLATQRVRGPSKLLEGIPTPNSY
jgi:hypothetical protein